MFVFLYFGASGIEEQSFEDEESPARRRARGTTIRSGVALLKSATARDTTDRERYGERQCVRYHRPKEGEKSASRATADGG